MVGEKHAACVCTELGEETAAYDSTCGDAYANLLTSDDKASHKLVDNSLMHYSVKTPDDYSTEALYATCGEERPLSVLSYAPSHCPTGREDITF